MLDSNGFVEAVVAGHGDRVPDGHAAGGRAEVPTFPSVLFTRPASVAILSLAFVAVVTPHLSKLIRVLRGQQAGRRLVLGDADAD